MMKLTIKNVGETAVEVPLSGLIDGIQPPSVSIGPQAQADATFKVPPANDRVSEAVTTWAQANGVSVELSFEPVAPPAPSSPPSPPPPLPLDPLGLL